MQFVCVREGVFLVHLYNPIDTIAWNLYRSSKSQSVTSAFFGRIPPPAPSPDLQHLDVAI